MGRWGLPCGGAWVGKGAEERKGVGEAEKLQENQEGEHAPKSLADCSW